MTEDVLDTDDEDVDPSFDLDSSLRSDLDDDWISHLEREALGLFCVSSSQSILTWEVPK